MKKSGLKNILLKAVVSVLLIVSFVSCTSVQETRSLEELYDEAMLDALYATPDEIRPLVVITPDSDMVSWNEDGDKILMISWNDKPELYEEKSTYKVEDDPIWTFTDKEILSWYDENEKEAAFLLLDFIEQNKELLHTIAIEANNEITQTRAELTICDVAASVSSLIIADLATMTGVGAAVAGPLGIGVAAGSALVGAVGGLAYTALFC